MSAACWLIPSCFRSCESCVQVPTDSTDSPTHEIQILETVVFVNPYETDLKQYYEEKAEKELEEKR